MIKQNFDDDGDAADCSKNMWDFFNEESINISKTIVCEWGEIWAFLNVRFDDLLHFSENLEDLWYRWKLIKILTTFIVKIYITFVNILASCCLQIMRVFSFIDYVCFCRSDSGWRCGGRFWILCSSRSCHAEFGRITRHRVKLNGTVGLSDENSADILVTRVLWFFRGGCNKLKIDKLKG